MKYLLKCNSCIFFFFSLSRYLSWWWYKNWNNGSSKSLCKFFDFYISFFLITRERKKKSEQNWHLFGIFPSLYQVNTPKFCQKRKKKKNEKLTRFRQRMNCNYIRSMKAFSIPKRASFICKCENIQREMK